MGSHGTQGLAVSPGLMLPVSAITQSIALLAVRRAGKSSAAAVMAEEMYAAGLPWVAIDPKGDWWGLRSSGDGTGPGLPVPIFGGLHGDVPLTPESGHLIADLIADDNLTCILDVSEFGSKSAQMRFLTDLAEGLFRRHGRDPQPRHLFLEEADDFVPQTVRANQARCVGAWTKLVKQGGSRGLGVTLISQRSAVVNKDALTQVETLIALRTTSPQDRKAISEWVSYHDVARELVDSLPGLDDGEAWVCSPHWLARHGQPAIRRIRFRQRSTFDSGATPTVEQARRPATLADIDTTVIARRMDAAADKAAGNDPALLRREIASLQRQLAEAASRPAERVEVPVLAPETVAMLGQAITTLRDITSQIEAVLGRSAPAPARPEPAPQPQRPAPAPAPRREPSPAAGGRRPGRAERAILTVLAQFPAGRSRKQIAMLAGYSLKGGGFGNALSALRTAGMITRDEPIQATDAGLAALGGAPEPLPSGPALADYWVGRLSKAEGLILRALLAAWPGSMTRAEIAAATGYAESGGGFGNALSRLRTLELITGYREMTADPDLATEATA
ncbi:MAG: hypothetical protein M0030_11530 [Actinomycetota bacterium]|nr:hypothetical protein [Actinomycetota bacterium]